MKQIVFFGECMAELSLGVFATTSGSRDLPATHTTLRSTSIASTETINSTSSTPAELEVTTLLGRCYARGKTSELDKTTSKCRHAEALVFIR